MKRVVFLSMLLMLSISSISFAQETKTELTNDAVATQVVDKFFENTTEAIKELASALKVPAEHVYQILVKQQVVEGIVNLIVVIILLLLTTGLSFWAYKAFDEDSEAQFAAALISLLIVGILFIIFTVTFFSEGLPHWLNPEYGALKEILEAI